MMEQPISCEGDTMGEWDESLSLPPYVKETQWDESLSLPPSLPSCVWKVKLQNHVIALPWCQKLNTNRGVLKEFGTFAFQGYLKRVKWEG